MEVKVTDTFGLEEDVLVSIRYGTVRRQAPLESVKSHPFKFPAQLEELSEPLKIDLLRPVASTRLVLHPQEEHYSIGFEQEDNIALGLHVMGAPPEAADTGAKEKESGKDSAASAKDYLEQKGLLKYVQSLLHAVIQDKPADPFSYMIEQLTAAKSKSVACERVMSRPTSAVSRPAGSRPVSARPNPPKGKPIAEAPVPPAPSETPTFLEVAQPEPVEEKDPKLEEALKELDDSAKLKSEMCQRLLAAAESGDLGTVLSSVGLDQSRQRIQSLLELSAESGDLEAALKLAMGQKELADLERLKMEMCKALEGANDTGRMLAVLEQSAPRAPLLAEEDLAKLALRDQLLGANEVGKVKEILDEIATERAKSEAERLKTELRDMLMEANESGKMMQVLQEMANGTSVPEPTEMERIKRELKSSLVDASDSSLKTALEKVEAHAVKKKLCGAMLTAAKSGKLAEVLDGMATEEPSPVLPPVEAVAVALPVEAVEAVPVIARRPSQAEAEILRENVRAKMQESLANGRLEEGLVTLARKKSAEPEPEAKPLQEVKEVKQVKEMKAPEDDLKKLGQEICGVLQEASQSGKLDEALELLKEEQQEVIRAAPEDELDAVRKNLCSLMQDAMLSGQLATALEQLKMKSEPRAATDVQVIKAKFRNLLREALESGTLASKVGLLKLIPKAPSPPQGEPPDEMDLLKCHLREALQHAAEAGHLAEALASLRSGPSESVEKTMLELQGTLTEAALSGTLAETLRSLRKANAEAETPPAVAEPSATPLPSPAAEEVAYGTQPVEEKELEELRGRLRNILSGAYDQGVLEQVVQDAVKKTHGDGPEELPALKAEVAKMRAESESLHSTVERLLREKEELTRRNEDLASRLTAD